MSLFMSLIGMAVLLGIALLLSNNRKAINFRTVGGAFAIQFLLGAFILYVPWGQELLKGFSEGVADVINYGFKGTEFVFGGLVSGKMFELFGGGGFVFAFRVLPTLIFFSAFISVLYYIGVMQWVIKLLGGALQKALGTSRAESMSAAANIFVGQTEVKETDIVACRKSIPRPTWEAPIRRVILIMMVVLLIGILLMGFIEANYIIEPWLLTRKVVPSQLSEAGFVHLRRMYVDYFKFIDSKAQTKAHNIKMLVRSSAMQHEETVQRIVQHRQKSIDRESNTSRATTKSTTSQKSKKSRNRNHDVPKSKPPRNCSN